MKPEVDAVKYAMVTPNDENAVERNNIIDVYFRPKLNKYRKHVQIIQYERNLTRILTHPYSVTFLFNKHSSHPTSFASNSKFNEVDISYFTA